MGTATPPRSILRVEIPMNRSFFFWDAHGDRASGAQPSKPTYKFYSEKHFNLIIYFNRIAICFGDNLNLPILYPIFDIFGVC